MATADEIAQMKEDMLIEAGWIAARGDLTKDTPPEQIDRLHSAFLTGALWAIAMTKMKIEPSR